MTWHGGFSGSVPLVAATKGNPMEKTIGLIPITDTLFTTYNIVITLALILVLPFVCRVMHPAPKDVVAVDASLLAREPTTRRELGPAATPAERIEEGPLLSYIVAAMGIVYLFLYFRANGLNININTVNMIMVIAGLILHRTPMAYARAISNAARGTAAIMIQFPFYAGIQIMMEELRPRRPDHQLVRRNRDEGDLPDPRLLLLGADQLRGALRRRPLGGAGAVRHAGGAGARRRPRQGGDGDRLRRGLDEHGAAVLGVAGAGDRRARRAGHHGLLRHRADRHRADLRLGPAVVRPSSRRGIRGAG